MSTSRQTLQLLHQCLIRQCYKREIVPNSVIKLGYFRSMLNRFRMIFRVEIQVAKSKASGMVELKPKGVFEKLGRIKVAERDFTILHSIR